MTDTTAYHRDDLSIDQQLALRTATARLGDEFADIYGIETIERFLHSSYDQFAAHSTVPNFLPMLAERFARQRLTALAKVEGLTTWGPIAAERAEAQIAIRQGGVSSGYRCCIRTERQRRRA
jgi:hypothetical protein